MAPVMADSREHAKPDRSRLRFVDTVSEAIAVVSQRPIRTLLTALGTILGVGAFVTTTGLATTASAQVSSRFDALRATEVRVQDAAPDGSDPFPDDVDARLETLNGANHAGLMFTVADNGAIQPRNTAARSLGIASNQIPVIAATPGAVSASLPTLATGRIYDQFAQTRGEHVALLGRVAADQLGVTRIDHQPVIFLDDTAYSVVGIVDDVARNPDLLLSVTVPTSAADVQFDTANAERQVIIDTAPGAAQLIGEQAPLVLRPEQPGRLQALVPPDPRMLRNQVESDVQTLFYAALRACVAHRCRRHHQRHPAQHHRTTTRNRAPPRPGRHQAPHHTTNHPRSRTHRSDRRVVGTTIGILAISATSIARGWTPTINPTLLVAAPAIGIITGTLAGLIPAVKAANTPPAETLRT